MYFKHFLSILDKIILSKSMAAFTITPIPNPGKDHCKSENYRPIALTSCLCKL